MAVHHAWGRTYKDLYQRFHAMLGQDQRWQNGFDCQGLWVEVNVERELGYASKRDIERNGIDAFVSLCKQRVLTYAAQQTEQSIRLGMWMDWNDPAELRRLRDLLAADPMQVITIEGPDGPVTDTVEMLVGRLGMPELGGSYFTFSNENNDLIWGFLAECHKRGWLYKGHDTMPWCARCGTGISQMEMNEGYQDREDPGLTVRFPLVDRPGEYLLVWTTTPWTLSANVAAAVGPGAGLRPGPPGRRPLLAGQGHAQDGAPGPVRGARGAARRRPRRLALRGPVRRAGGGAGRRSRATDERPAYRHRVVAWEEVGEDEGTGIVHIAPGCGAEDHQLGKALRLPVIGPLDESGPLPRRASAGSPASMPRRSRRGSSRTSRRKGFFYHLEPYSTATRTAGAATRRCSTGWWTSGTSPWAPSYDIPRGDLTREQVDRSLRYQIMDVVDDIRWIPASATSASSTGCARWATGSISKKRYWGLALPIWECAECGGFDVIGGRAELRERAVEGWEAFEGHTPHRPLRGRGHASPARPAAVSRSASGTSATPGWTRASCPSPRSTTARTRRYWEKWFPADFITESFPGQFRNWFYSMLAMSTVLRREAPFKTILGYATVFGEDGRPMHKSWGNAIEFDEAAERMGVDVMRWMYARQRAEDNILFGYDAADEARRELLVLWNVVSFLVTYAASGRLDAGRRGRGRPPTLPAGATPLDRWIVSRAAGARRRVPGVAGRLRCARRDPGHRRAHRRPVAVVPAPLASTAVAQRRRRRPGRGVRGRSTWRSCRWSGCARPSCRSWPRSCTRCWSRSRPRPTGTRRARLGPPHALAGRGAGGRCATPRSRRPWPTCGGPWTWAARCAPSAGIKVRQPLAQAVAGAARRPAGRRRRRRAPTRRPCWTCWPTT